ncbi:MAG: hypothetical protein AAFN74_20510 [Myxococcota bacterium]
MRDRNERRQYEVYDRIWETEEALSNRARFFAAGVLAVSWGLLVQEAGIENASLFDMRLVLAAAVLSVTSLVFDFLYFTFRRGALRHAAHSGSNDLDGSGPSAKLAILASSARLIFFAGAASALVFAAINALLPVVSATAN